MNDHILKWDRVDWVHRALVNKLITLQEWTTYENMRETSTKYLSSLTDEQQKQKADIEAKIDRMPTTPVIIKVSLPKPKQITDEMFAAGRYVTWGNTIFSIVRFETNKTQVVYMVKLYNGSWPPDQELIEECAGVGYIRRKVFGLVEKIDDKKRRVTVFNR